MTKRANKVSFRGRVSHRHEASDLLKIAGDAVLVDRGVARSIAMACPDGCGEELTINVDRRSGPAWRYYLIGSELSLYPSVWRSSGCRSHFIVWRSRVYWCDWEDELEGATTDVIERTFSALGSNFVSYLAIADDLDAIPWAVLSACRELCRRGLAEAGRDRKWDHFRLRPQARSK